MPRPKSTRLPIPNPDDPTGSTMLVPLTRGYFAIIDAADAGLVARHLWCAVPGGKGWYARTSVWKDGKQVALFLHQLLCDEGSPMVDHWDRDGLNCRRSNLRPATRSQNAANCLPRGDRLLKGVTLYKPGVWLAQISFQRKRRHIGYFDTPEDAAAAYDAKARELHGEFARTNDPGH